MCTTAPKASVDITKNEPFSRMVIAPSPTAAAALIAAPIHMPISGLMPAFRNNNVET